MKQINNIFNPFILNQIINEVNYENESMYILPILINIFYKLAGHSTTKNNTPIKYIKDGEFKEHLNKSKTKGETGELIEKFIFNDNEQIKKFLIYPRLNIPELLNPTNWIQHSMEELQNLVYQKVMESINEAFVEENIYDNYFSQINISDKILCQYSEVSSMQFDCII